MFATGFVLKLLDKSINFNVRKKLLYSVDIRNVGHYHDFASS